MAQDIQIKTTCDPCDHDGYRNIDAVDTVRVTINGGPLKDIDVCARDKEGFRRLLAIYDEYGQPVETRKSAPVRELPAVKEEPKAIEAPKPKKDTKAGKKRAGKNTKAESGTELTVICPLPHPSKNGEPQRVVYSTRNTHVKQCHPGVNFCEVKWGDPDGILKFPCTAHKECVASGMSFKSAAGLTQHMRSIQLTPADPEETQE
jgi:hypothetical protein